MIIKKNWEGEKEVNNDVNYENKDNFMPYYSMEGDVYRKGRLYDTYVELDVENGLNIQESLYKYLDHCFDRFVIYKMIINTLLGYFVLLEKHQKL